MAAGAHDQVIDAIVGGKADEKIGGIHPADDVEGDPLARATKRANPVLEFGEALEVN